MGKCRHSSVRASQRVLGEVLVYVLAVGEQLSEYLGPPQAPDPREFRETAVHAEKSDYPPST